MNEIEIKLRVARRADLLRRLRRLGARSVASRVHEVNVLYDTPRRALLQKGQLLRVRMETPAPVRSRRFKAKPNQSHRVTLTYKGPANKGTSKAPYKIREEDEVLVSPVTPLSRILKALGLEVSFYYEKYRQEFRLPGLPGLAVQFDETPIGDFVELEGKTADIDRAAALLGYATSDYINKGYPALYFEAMAKGRNQQRKSIPKPAKSAKGKSAKKFLLPGMSFSRGGVKIGR